MQSKKQYYVDHFFKVFIPSVERIFFARWLKSVSVSLVLLSCIVILPALGMYGLYYAYNQNFQNMAAISESLSESALKQRRTIDSVVNLEKMLIQDSIPIFSKIFFFSLHDQELALDLKRVQDEYTQANAVPIMTLFLEEVLSNDCHKGDVESLVDTFEIYSMILGKEPFDKQQVINWYLARMSKFEGFSGMRAELIKEVLDDVKITMFQHVHFADGLYTRALSQLHIANLPQLILRSAINKFNLGSDFTVSRSFAQNTVDILDKELLQVSIPFLYTSEGHNKYTAYQTQVFAKIFGINHIFGSGDTNLIKEVVRQTNYLYVSNYIEYWNYFFSKMHLKSLLTLEQCFAVLKGMATEKFAMFELARTVSRRFYITDNKSQESIAQGLSGQISQRIYDLIPHRVKNAERYKDLDAKEIMVIRDKFFGATKGLVKYLADIVNSPNINHASFEAISQFENAKDSELQKALDIIDFMPEPVASLYEELIRNIINILYREAGSHLNESIDLYLAYTKRLTARVDLRRSIDIEDYFYTLKEIASESELVALFDSLALCNKVSRAQTPLGQQSQSDYNKKEYNAALARAQSTAACKSIIGLSLEETRAKFSDSLQTLIKFLGQLVSHNDHNYAAYLAVKEFEVSKESELQKALALSHTFADNVGELHQAIVTNAISLLYARAELYIEQQWQLTVRKFYIENLYGKYPLDKRKYAQQISLEDFRNFFAPQGIVDSFASEHLSLKQLQMNERASDFLKFVSDVRQTWFAPDGNMILKFHVTPMGVGDKLANINLDFSGQKIALTQEKLESFELTWPTAKGAPYSKIELIDNRKYKSSYYYEGPWSWYRLLKFDEATQAVAKLPINLELPLSNIQLLVSFGKVTYFPTSAPPLPEKIFTNMIIESPYVN